MDCLSMVFSEEESNLSRPVQRAVQLRLFLDLLLQLVSGCKRGNLNLLLFTRLDGHCWCKLWVLATVAQLSSGKESWQAVAPCLFLKAASLLLCICQMALSMLELVFQI